MTANKGRAFPIIITCLLIMIIIYLFASVEQPYITCSRTNTNDLGIHIKEKFNVYFDGSKISEIDLTKTIIFPENYLKDKSNLIGLKFMLEKHYDYLGKKKVSFSSSDDRLIVNVKAEDNGDVLLLNNIEFFDDGELEIKINPNSRSSDVVSLSIYDKYSEGEFITRMRNNGYSCN